MDKNLLIFSEPVIFAVFVENFLEFKTVEKRIGFLVRNTKSTCHFVNFGFRKDSIVEKTGLKYINYEKIFPILQYFLHLIKYEGKFQKDLLLIFLPFEISADFLTWPALELLWLRQSIDWHGRLLKYDKDHFTARIL